MGIRYMRMTSVLISIALALELVDVQNLLLRDKMTHFVEHFTFLKFPCSIYLFTNHPEREGRTTEKAGHSLPELWLESNSPLQIRAVGMLTTSPLYDTVI